MTKDCPNCGLVNHPSATRCDCGFDFASGTVKESYVGPTSPDHATAKLWFGLTIGDLILIVLLPALALIVGIVRAVRKRAGAAMMINISLVWMLLLIALKFLVR